MKEDMVLVGPEMAEALRPFEGRNIFLRDQRCLLVRADLFTVTVVWGGYEAEAAKEYRERLAKADRMFARSKWFVRILYVLSAAFIFRTPIGWGWLSALGPVLGWAFFEFYFWPRAALRRREIQ